MGKKKSGQKKVSNLNGEREISIGKKKRCKRRGEIKVVRKMCRTKRNTSQAGVEPTSCS